MATWGDPANTTLRALRPGDFLMFVPAQKRVAAWSANSTVANIVTMPNRWRVYPTGRRGKRDARLVDGVRVEVVTPRGTTKEYPADFTCRARLLAHDDECTICPTGQCPGTDCPGYQG